MKLKDEQWVRLNKIENEQPANKTDVVKWIRKITVSKSIRRRTAPAVDDSTPKNVLRQLRQASEESQATLNIQPNRLEDSLMNG